MIYLLLFFFGVLFYVYQRVHVYFQQSSLNIRFSPLPLNLLPLLSDLPHWTSYNAYPFVHFYTKFSCNLLQILIAITVFLTLFANYKPLSAKNRLLNISSFIFWFHFPSIPHTSFPIISSSSLWHYYMFFSLLAPTFSQCFLVLLFFS